MAYSVVSDVRSICDTNLSDPQITNIITWVDALIDLKIDSGAAGAVFLEALSSSWAAYRVMLKDPNARSLGEYSENRNKTLELLWEQIQDMLALADGGIAFIATREGLA